MYRTHQSRFCRYPCRRTNASRSKLRRVDPRVHSCTSQPHLPHCTIYMRPYMTNCNKRRQRKCHCRIACCLCRDIPSETWRCSYCHPSYRRMTWGSGMYRRHIRRGQSYRYPPSLRHCMLCIPACTWCHSNALQCNYRLSIPHPSCSWCHWGSCIHPLHYTSLLCHRAYCLAQPGSMELLPYIRPWCIDWHRPERRHCLGC